MDFSMIWFKIAYWEKVTRFELSKSIEELELPVSGATLTIDLDIIMRY